MSDFTIDNINISGVPGYVQIEETTSQTLFDKYKEYIDLINKISNLPSPTAAEKKQLLEAINGLRDILTNGMKLPVDSSNPNSAIKQYYMTPAMVTSIEVIFSSLKLVGADVTQSPIVLSDTQISDWGGLVKNGGILNGVVAYVQGLANVGIQRFIEIVIVKDANDRLDKAMGDLQKALDVTKRCMDTIKSLQEMQNQVSYIKEKIPESAWKGDTEEYKKMIKELQDKGIESYVPYNYTIDDPDIVNLLQNLIQRIKSNPEDIGIFPFGTGALLPAGVTLSPETMEKYHIRVITPVPGAPQRYYIDDPAVAGKFLKLDQLARSIATPGVDSNAGYTFEIQGGKAVITPKRGSLHDELGAIFAELPGGAKNSAQVMVNKIIELREKISKNIEELLPITPKLPDGTVDPNSLVGRLQKVLDDLNSKFTTPSGAPIDRNTSLADAWVGMHAWVLNQEDVQQNLSYAITAGQSLNERQKEDVRQALYLYEQLVKLTSSLIESLQQLYTKPLQGIR